MISSFEIPVRRPFSLFIYACMQSLCCFLNCLNPDWTSFLKRSLHITSFSHKLQSHYLRIDRMIDKHLEIVENFASTCDIPLIFFTKISRKTKLQKKIIYIQKNKIIMCVNIIEFFSVVNTNILLMIIFYRKMKYICMVYTRYFNTNSCFQFFSCHN